MKIVVLDGYATNPGDLSWEALEALGSLTVYDRSPSEDEAELVRRTKGADIVLTNKTKVPRVLFEQEPRIRYVGVMATGYNIVDVEAANEHGVVVTNVPTYGTDSVAQFAIAMLLEVCHRIGHHARRVAEGAWSANPDWTFWEYPLMELAGKTMGIVGYGRIGRRTGEIAEALGMQVLAYSPSKINAGAPFTDLDTLLRTSDVISLHSPLTAENAKMINAESISRMKNGVVLLNNARGGLIDEPALALALNEGKVAAAALDVVSEEPIREDNPLLHAKNCLITPHIAWAPFESRARLMDAVVENVRAFIEGKPQNVVGSRIES